MQKRTSKEHAQMIAHFPWVGNRTLHQHIQGTKHNRENWREQLESPLYWVKRGRKFWWNLVLVKDWFLNGPSESHNRLVEEYLASLEPQTETPSTGRAA